MAMRAGALPALMGAVVALTLPAGAQDLADKTVRLMLNLGSGSVADVTMRQLAPFIRKNLPGGPTVIVENRPGGQRTLAGEVLSRMPPDGLTLGVLTGYVGEWAVNAEVRVPPDRLTVIGSLSAEAAVLMRTNLKVEKAEDLRSANRTIFAGSASATSGHVLRMRLFLDAIGVPGRTITGYKGQVEMTQALMRDELDMASYNWDQFLIMRGQFESEGKIAAPLIFGELDDRGGVAGSPVIAAETMDAAWRRLAPGKVDTPEYQAFRLMYLIQSVSRLYALAPGTSRELAEMWVRALQAAHADPEYKRITTKMGASEPELAAPAVVLERIRRIESIRREPAVDAAIKRVSE